MAASGVASVTVSLVNSFANDRDERRVAELAREAAPGVPLSLSCDVLPEMREYERAATTVANAYVSPVVSCSLQGMDDQGAARNMRARLRVLCSDGGLMGTARAAPVNLLMSGPAGGIAGAIRAARQAGLHNLLTFDMGGISTDVALVEDGQARLRRETAVGDVSVRTPSLDIRTVGAGGGSLARVPELTGALRVGPESAGALPGPAAERCVVEMCDRFGVDTYVSALDAALARSRRAMSQVSQRAVPEEMLYFEEGSCRVPGW